MTSPDSSLPPGYFVRIAAASLAAAALFFPSVDAFADPFAPQSGSMLDPQEEEQFAKAEERGVETPTGTYFFPSGWAFTLGGGVNQFTDSDVEELAELGIAWDARLAAGTRMPFAVELAYVGSARTIKAPGIDDDDEAKLTVSAFDLAGRWNVLPDQAIQPFLVAGVGYMRFDVAEGMNNTSIVNGADHVFDIPLSAGIAFKWRRIVTDLRGTYRWTFEDELIEDASLSSYELTLRAGLEF